MPSADRIRIAPADAALLDPCRAGVILPERDLSDLEAETFWRRDRVALAECRDRHGALADHVKGLEAALQPAKD